MARRIAGLLTALALLVWPALALAQVSKPPVFGQVDTGHVAAELVPETASIAPGQTIHVALVQTIEKGWHTYWRNSGDSGEPTLIKWALPAGWSAGEIVWPTPERQPTGDLMNYGYKGTVLLPVALTAPADARPGETVELTAAVAYLVCADICVPEDTVLGVRLPVSAQPGGPGRAARDIAAALADAPKTAPLAAAFEAQGQALKLAIAGAPLSGADFAGAYFFPYEGTVIDHAKPQAIERGPEGLTFSLTAGYAFQGPTPPASLAGVLALADGRAFEIAAQPGPPPAGAYGLGPPPAPVDAAAGGTGLGLPLALGFALLGGLLLNLMPCVFPILAMKAASLAGHGSEVGEARRHALAFLAGVMATFLALAGALIALQAAGAAAGWGFQLQSPPVVAALALLMLAVALNLSGVFELGTSLQGAGSGLASRTGLAGAFFTGALAVVVAAPCTAPFMAPALGWALTQSAPAALAVFAALALGFAAPFVLVAFAPGVIRRLPRPGPWMITLKKVLAFPMYGAAAWLVWVLTVQAGDMALARILAAGVVLALAAWLFGLAQRRRAEGARPMLAGSAAAVAGAAALAAALWPAYRAAEPQAQATAAAIPYEAYSPERVAAAQAEGRAVFVNFTAAWCITCKVNERAALSSAEVAQAFSRTGALYLKADWTNKDDVIAAELARHGRAGVPLYLVYGKGGGDGVILPQILTERAVVRALETASASQVAAR